MDLEATSRMVLPCRIADVLGDKEETSEESRNL
jgi:hypothetical protein